MIQAAELQRLRQRVNGTALGLWMRAPQVTGTPLTFGDCDRFAKELELHNARMRQPTMIMLTARIFYLAHSTPQIHRFCQTHGIPRPTPEQRVFSEYALHGYHGATVLVFDGWEESWRGSRGWKPEFFHGLKLTIIRVSDREVEKNDLVKFEKL